MGSTIQSRRAFLGTSVKTAVGAAALGSAVLLGSSMAFARVPKVGSGGLLRGIAYLRPFSGDWVITAIYGPIAGGVTLTIRNGLEGRPIRVDVSLRDVEVKAPAFTKHLELFVMDGGGGVREMPDDLMVALGDLASLIEDNEDDPRLLEGLMTFTERWEHHPEFMARAACELEPTAP